MAGAGRRRDPPHRRAPGHGQRPSSISSSRPRPRALLGRYAEQLEHLGYPAVPDPTSPDRHFFAKPPARPRTHHLHVCEAGSDDEFRHIAMRDILRTHRDETASYADLKRHVAARHPQDRLAYIEGKHDHVTALEQRAVAWARRPT